MFAAAVSAASGVPIGAAGPSVKATAQQVGLSRSERATNVQGAFRVPPEGKAAVAGRRLVLVGDVLTSGATVDGCARALLLVFARVADPVRTSI
jgi:predicted amidophosphoribosyltransferase